MRRRLARAALAACALIAAGAAAAQPRPADPAAALCAGQPQCRVVDRRGAGDDANGRPLVVVELALAARAGDEDAPACRPHRRQFWLMSTPPRLILDLCNDGYGAAGVGEDRVAAGPNRVTHTQTGGSAWRWSGTRVIQLSPLQVQRDAGRGWWTLGPNVEQSEWDWRRFAGTTAWWAPSCAANGEPPEDAQAPAQLPFEFAPIPRVAEAAVPANAADAELGSCALAIDAGGRTGYVVAGAASVPAAPGEWLRALLIGERTLVVTVGSGPWTAAASGTNADHVELWLGGLVGYGAHCLDPRDRPTQWAIAIADGALTRGSGDAGRRIELRARRERRVGLGSVVTFVIGLPPDIHTLTAALARGDGRRPGRMIATSRLRPGIAATLGQARPIDPAAVRCAVRDGRLDLVETGRPEMLRNP